jgi:hypothetical protein
MIRIMPKASKRQSKTQAKYQRALMSSRSESFRAKPEYDHWAKMARWNWHQGLILMLDRDPHHWLQYNSSLGRFELTGNADAIPPELRAEYEKFLEVMMTYRLAVWTLEDMPPREYVEWAAGIALSVPGVTGPHLVVQLRC